VEVVGMEVNVGGKEEVDCCVEGWDDSGGAEEVGRHVESGFVG